MFYQRYSTTLKVLFALSELVVAQQQCYYGAGAQYRGPSNLVPCNTTGTSSCCLLGDTCLSGSSCYNPITGNLYQYGCTDITYNDGTCPYKCGFDPARSPWTALEYCNDVQDLENTWICHGPESCGCEWKSSFDMLVLAPRGCKAMGSDALVALYAPSTLAPYVSLPSTAGGSTGYYSPTLSDGTSSWVETAVAGYTPSEFTQLTTYRDAPTTSVWVDAKATPGPSTYASAASYTGAAPTPTDTNDIGSDGETSSGTDPSLATSASDASDGLSTGAKAGIGAGVGGGVLLLAILVLAFCLIRRRRNKTRQHQIPPPAYPPSYPHSPQMHQQQPSPFPPQTSWSPYPAVPQIPEQYFDETPPVGHVSRETSQKSADLRATSGPLELSADAAKVVHEMDGKGSARANEGGGGRSASGTSVPGYTERGA